MLRGTRRLQAVREHDEVQALDGDVPVPRYPEDRNPGITRGIARRRGTAAAHRVRGGRPDGSHLPGTTGRVKRSLAERATRKSRATVHVVRHLRGRQLRGNGTRRVRRDRGYG